MTSKVVYKGDLRTEATHLQSGTVIYTDAPVDNHGKGNNFSPTDLVATALASCMTTIMGIASNTHNINIVGTTCNITKIMQAAPRKITEVVVEVFIKGQAEYSDKEKEILKKAALTCPVALTLGENVTQTISFYFNNEASI